MMKRSLILILAGIAILLAPRFVPASDTNGPITGTWQCQAKGGSQGDTPFTLYLQQSGESIEGRVDSPLGDTDITSGSFKDGVLEIHIDSSDGNYLLKAKFDKGTLSGTYSKDNETQGTWEGKKQADSPK